MAKRYGRNQRRQHRETIAELERKLYGDWGVPPDHLERIDHIPHESIVIHSNKSVRLVEEDVTITYLGISDRELDKMTHARERGVILRYEDMCLFPSHMMIEQDEPIGFGSISDHRPRILDIRIIVEFKRVPAPRMLTWNSSRKTSKK